MSSWRKFWNFILIGNNYFIKPYFFFEFLFSSRFGAPRVKNEGNIFPLPFFHLARLCGKMSSAFFWVCRPLKSTSRFLVKKKKTSDKRGKKLSPDLCAGQIGVVHPFLNLFLGHVLSRAAHHFISSSASRPFVQLAWQIWSCLRVLCCWLVPIFCSSISDILSQEHSRGSQAGERRTRSKHRVAGR